MSLLLMTQFSLLPQISLPPMSYIASQAPGELKSQPLVYGIEGSIKGDRIVNV